MLTVVDKDGSDGTPVRAAGVRSSLDPNPALLRKDLASVT
jgi:hypothetical protein